MFHEKKGWTNWHELLGREWNKEKYTFVDVERQIENDWKTDRAPHAVKQVRIFTQSSVLLESNTNTRVARLSRLPSWCKISLSKSL